MDTKTMDKVLAATAALSQPSQDPFGKYLQIAEVVRHAESLRRAERRLFVVLDRYTPEVAYR